MLKRTKPLQKLFIVSLSATLLFLPSSKASAGLIEYGFLLEWLANVIDAISKVEPPQGSQVVIDQLDAAIEGARAANLVGNRVMELSRLSKAIGAAEALLGLTSACTNCGDLRETLQQIIGQAALLKTSAVGASGACQPNGVIEPNEQCDPLAIPTGCPVNTTAVTYCSDECLCQIVPSL